MRQMTAPEVHAQKVSELGLDATALDLTSTEAIAGALRRAAGFLCPCASTTLVRNVVRPLRCLVGDLDTVKALVEETLEALIAHGDIVEQPEVEADGTGTGPTLLYAAPACFVVRQTDAVILLGIASDQVSALPADLESRIEYVNHVRRLSPTAGEDLRTELGQLGLIEVSCQEWLKAPPRVTAEQHVAQLDHLLNEAQPSREVPDLSLLDTGRSVGYYRGRWIEPRSQSGRFVARRSQAYGSQLWCYIQLRDGNPERLVDFPTPGSRWRGCDDAWRLQMAIDARRGEPQRFRVRPGPERTRVLEFFSPVPMWARRRLDAVGEPLPSSGCLFAYRLKEAEMMEEVHFVRDVLWLDQMK